MILAPNAKGVVPGSFVDEFAATDGGEEIQVAPDTEVVLMTGHASMETAIEAVRLGAFDYITKPCQLGEIEAILRKIAEKRDLKNKNLALQSRVQAAEGPSILVGNSPAIIAVSHPRHDSGQGLASRFRVGHRPGSGRSAGRRSVPVAGPQLTGPSVNPRSGGAPAGASAWRAIENNGAGVR